MLVWACAGLLQWFVQREACEPQLSGTLFLVDTCNPSSRSSFESIREHPAPRHLSFPFNLTLSQSFLVFINTHLCSLEGLLVIPLPRKGERKQRSTLQSVWTAPLSIPSSRMPEQTSCCPVTPFGTPPSLGLLPGSPSLVSIVLLPS